MNILLIINLIAISAAIIGCAAATITDLRTKIIPNKIPLAMLVLSVPIALLRLYFIGFEFIILWILNFAGAFVIAYLLWNMRAWAGGDAKMFWAVIALIPVYPEVLIDLGVNLSEILADSFTYSVSQNITVTPQLLPPYLHLTFIATFFLNFGMILLTKFLFAAMFKAARERKLLVFLRLIVTPLLFVFSAVSFASGLAITSGIQQFIYLSIVFILVLSWIGKNNYLYSFALGIILLSAGLVMCNVTNIDSFAAFTKTKITIIFFVFLLSAYAVGTRDELIAEVEIDKLKEGMPLAERIYLENRKITRKSGSLGIKETLKSWIKKGKNIRKAIDELKGKTKKARIIAAPAPMGLVSKDIEILKKYKNELDNSVKIHIAVELMPFMLLALLISLFVGDLMWLFLYLGRI